jgi:3-deoxy-D-manno-octulosonic-acid transferase
LPETSEKINGSLNGMETGFYSLLKTSFTHFFVQNNSSLNLLKKKRIFNSSVMGDSRFDRVKSLLRSK